ncbi:MAG: dTMP kinase [Minisyncoccales bacterium]
MFIVFEGIDGAGTSTQAKKLAEKLNHEGIITELTNEPTEERIGKLAREVLQKKWQTSPEALQLLFCADRADHIFKKINPALKNNKSIISERYFYSTIIYGSLHVDQKWLKELCKIFIEPDLIFYLDLPEKIAIERIKERGEKIELFEKEDFLKKVRNGFNEIFQNKKNVYKLDGRRSIDEVHKEIYEIVKSVYSMRKI